MAVARAQENEPDHPHGTSIGDGWRESSRTARRAPAQRRVRPTVRAGQSRSASRLIAAPHVHVIQTRSPSMPPSSSPQYWCKWRMECPTGSLTITGNASKRRPVIPAS